MSEKREEKSTAIDCAEATGLLVKKPCGFAALSPEQRQIVSSMGGRSAHAQGTAHKWTVDEARAAGRKGGKATRAKKQKVLAPEQRQIISDIAGRAQEGELDPEAKWSGVTGGYHDKKRLENCPDDVGVFRPAWKGSKS